LKLAEAQLQAQAQAQAQAQTKALAASAADIRSQLDKAMGAEATAPGEPKVKVETTDEGVLISLTDDIHFEMFASGSAVPDAQVVKMVAKLAQILKARPGRIIIRGHTDAVQFATPGNDNWRLSSARAHIAYYMLVRGGLDEKRVDRIEGYADRHLKFPDKPLAPENRRIEILLRQDKT
jgi:chemotaxis protein MotB